MTQKFDNFVAELEALCKGHKVALSTNGYETLIVWNFVEPDDTALDFCGIRDRTDN